MTKVDVIEDGEFDFDKSARSAKIVRNLPFHQTVRRIMRDIEETFHDKYRYVTLSFYVYGLAGLMPWNFYITPENYWNDKLTTNDTFSPDGSFTPNWMQNFWQNFLSILCTGVVFLSSILLQFRPQSWSKENLLSIGVAVSVVLFIATAVVGIFDNTGWEVQFFWINLALGTVLNAFCSVVQNMGMAMAGSLGETYVRNLSSGQGFAGIFAALAYMINLCIAGSPTSAGISFFCTAGAFALFALINHLCVIKTDFYKSKMLDEPNSKSSDAELVSDASSEGSSQDPARSRTASCNSGSSSPQSLIWTIHPELFMSFITLFVTLSVFPGVAASGFIGIFNGTKIFAEKWFVPVCTFLVYNIGDTIGRLMTNFCQVPSRDSTISIYLVSALRLIFIVLFPLCNVQRMPSATLPTLISSDIGYAVLVLLLAISNGYLTTLREVF
ncbi:Oidioi.mRNA.OKI2018_I69.PAR.g11698.t1.cds [Oikopleura dioica]|uniref:Oidioi.mRNA.OKI2018_I69.PAR.g11698.t1.cds n=1 Tax=Oikopleura dioica TaxID=34765 RepID=A0ABN7S457_OIKDI|nr:Oidioi.mRNA.OKI2018_I69.PAR.g11698.t1.cds [Oikopleura dioica]